MNNIRPTAAQIAQQQAAQRQTGQTVEPQPPHGQPAEGRYGIGFGENWMPPPIKSIEATGLNIFYLSELVLKVLYFSGFKSGYGIAEAIRLPFTGVVEQVMEFLKRERQVEVRGSGGFGEGAYQYVITGAGIEKAREAMERSQYAGPAPVPLIVLNDWRSGRPLALIAADRLTAARTAAMSAVAARHYARPESERIGFVGCGVQAASHFDALRDLFPGLRLATVVGRRIEAARAFADGLRALGIEARASEEPRDAVADQDLVVTTVPNGLARPFLDANWLANGAFVAAADLGRSWRRDGLAAFARVITDEREQSVELAREGQLVSGGPYEADLADIAAGRIPRPRDPAGRTLFAFSGHGAADLAGAILIYEAALRRTAADTPLR